ncbi:DUF1761 domain-containing protein [Candidatus Woesearchaeota archaeon]|nr:DUF1761 domain-containing protein [Candidatus Woesearchaeota archaeon]
MVNYLAVLVAAVVAFLLGFIWYGPLFGKIWMKLSGMPDVKPKKKDMMLRSLGGLASYIVMAYVLARIFDLINVVALSEGLWVGFLAWLGFVGTITFGSFLWEKKPFNLWLLNNVYNLISLLIMAWIFVVWV